MRVKKSSLIDNLTFRRQKSFEDEEESFQKQKRWLREREVEEAHKTAFEKERREIIARKRDRSGKISIGDWRKPNRS